MARPAVVRGAGRTGGVQPSTRGVGADHRRLAGRPGVGAKNALGTVDGLSGDAVRTMWCDVARSRPWLKGLLRTEAAARMDSAAGMLGPLRGLQPATAAHPPRR